MSLIVARKDHTSVIIVSDTHLSYPDAKSVSERQIHHPSAGVIKTNIVNSNIAISFAGGEVYADEAFKLIKANMSLSDVTNIVLREHLYSNGDTDFIIATCDPEPRIFEVKNSVCSEVDMAWIGSKKAFTTFQTFMQGMTQNYWSSTTYIQRLPEGLDTALFTKMNSAIDHVIEHPGIPEVDGFRVSTVFTKGSFQYIGYVYNHLVERFIDTGIPMGVKTPLPHGTAQDGGYIINFFDSFNFNYAGLHIVQGNFGIIYERKNGGLMRPHIITSIDEFDFINYVEDTYKLKPSVLVQDQRSKCVKQGDKAFDVDDYISALSWYDKGLEYCEGKDRAVFYYRKSYAYLNLGQYEESIQMANKTLESDREQYEGLILELIKEIRRRGVEIHFVYGQP